MTVRIYEGKLSIGYPSACRDLDVAVDTDEIAGMTEEQIKEYVLDLLMEQARDHIEVSIEDFYEEEE